ncbi:Predicted flavoprotein CzcO associated with the cation diffusion facilitator CzcD [Amycolatopsis marina]|uniref:4-hydroxybenzoate brominase (decarboxylating) n=1 Tax=Amycolatopsis marina TaxID=490629 RepID=A0A1I1AU08_9PSEU|nr:NAD(P)-binding domain-containing protein [Amycolatopsis marina]SFB41501.1 Predicted flavoprotein CzcO associated with the cation diffusion facilitator CzcD [Amycolatopsis marina]
MSPRTCIIGAGISGLTAGKMLSDYGIPYICFESSDRIGGNWAFGNPNGHSSAYRSLHIDSSRHRLSFKDFPMPEHFPDFPHHSHIKEYLEEYAEAFSLKNNIRFRTAVQHARRLPAGGWEIRTEDEQVHRFDALVVANGHHWDARFPDFPGEFEGRTLHSHHYIDPRTPLDLTGQRILIVGLGNSAADIAVELSQRALDNTVVLSTRSSAWIVPKYIMGIPADTLFATSPHVPLSWQRRLSRKSPVLLTGRPERFGLPTPNHHFLEAHPTQSQELPLRLGSGDVTAKPNVSRLAGRSVEFADGTREEFDVIIYATGYNITFPFFDPDFISAPDNRFPLYKRMFKPGVDDLAFVGFAQSTPTLFPFVECQSRLLAAWLGGLYRPPSDEVMRRVIVADERRFVGHFADRPRHTQQVDYFVYEHEVRTKELPGGLRRVRERGPVALTGRGG